MDFLEVTSKDGTTIASSVGGHGPPLVLVHPTTGSDFSWALVRPYLEDHRTVHAMQRRGRGRSGDAPDYALAREAEDVAAVVDAIGGAVGLVGHSHGANCALEASLLTDGIDRMVLYEPALLWSVDEGVLGRVGDLIARGALEDATLLYLRDAVGLTEDELEMLRASPTWPDRVGSAPTFAREDRAVVGYDVEPDRFGEMRVPTLLLTGTESPEPLRRSVERVAAVLPSVEVHVLEGEGHVANVTAPERLAAEIDWWMGE
jgi:pimeloyl-ACP methyl ester carboxylesterase